MKIIRRFVPVAATIGVLLLPFVPLPSSAAGYRIAGALAAQAAAPTAAGTLRERLDTSLNVPVLKHAIVGALVRSLKDGATVYERNADTALMPASNQKILTATAALGLLGTDFRYTTTLYRTGTIGADGTLTGDLYLRGTGDPSLTSADVKEMALALAKAGVKAFRGHIYADATRFDDQLLGDGWQWDDEAFYYQAQVSALNCDENVVLVEVRPGDVLGATPPVLLGGDNATSLGFAESTYLRVTNAASTGSGNDPLGTDTTRGVHIERLRARNDILVTGTIPLGAMPTKAVLTVEDPARFTATRLYELLPLAGITTAGKPDVELGTVPADAVTVAEHKSKPLSALLADFLKPSDNLYGECLLKTLGVEKGKAGSWSEGAKAVRGFLQTAGIDAGGLTIADGSGLSRLNNVTPRILVDVLTYADTKFPVAARNAFLNALPVGGKDGTLRNRFKGTPIEGNLHAKTGSLNGVSSLSGYLTAKNGERYVFSLLMNHYTGGGTAAQARAAQDAFVRTLSEQ